MIENDNDHKGDNKDYDGHENNDRDNKYYHYYTIRRINNKIIILLQQLTINITA